MAIFGRLRELIDKELRQPVPPQFSIRHLLGGLALFLLLIEIVSGILLMVYYRPSADEAYESVRYIMSEAQLGWLIRGIHKWGADLFIIVLLGHLWRVYFQGAYRERELNWAIGVLLLLLTGAFAFTGVLLIWDQPAFWGTDAARRLIERVPILGSIILNLLWGGRELEAGALLRFYVFHVGLLPWLTIALVLVHLYFVSRQGLFSVQVRKYASAQVANSPKSYADLLLDGLLVALVAVGILLTLTVLFAPALGERVDPLQPVPAKTVWYFLPAYALLKVVSGGWGLFLLGLGVLGLFFVPLLSRSPRWLARGLGVGAGAILALLGVLGYLRGGLP